MSTWLTLLIFIIITIIYVVIMFFYQRKIVKILTQAEFIQGYRKAQIIDIREPNVFKAGHILGARNIPISQLRTRISELRNDQPVYMYDQNGLNIGRAGMIIRKKGIKNLYQLQGGFKGWTGKIKKK
jgi:rhodanese-related sulfurtransferase